MVKREENICTYFVFLIFREIFTTTFFKPFVEMYLPIWL